MGTNTASGRSHWEPTRDWASWVPAHRGAQETRGLVPSEQVALQQVFPFQKPCQARHNPPTPNPSPAPSKAVVHLSSEHVTWRNTAPWAG